MTLRGRLGVQLIDATHDLLKLTLSETPPSEMGVERAKCLLSGECSSPARPGSQHTP